MRNKIFLGGTCAESTWRDDLKPALRKMYHFNPVVKEWTPECQMMERLEKEIFCNIHFYCITQEMKGVFSIAEVVDSVHNKNKTTILHVIPTGFESFQLKSLKAVVDLVNQRGGIAYIQDDISYSIPILQSIFESTKDVSK